MAETFNLSQLPGYWTGGTVHIIANNQLGFTTEPDEGRSTLYASDLAKGFKVPIVHVNADDPAACIEVACIAFAYQQEFEKDFLIDLIGYRRYGHNELDEPGFTQPQLYETVRKHPTTRQLWARCAGRTGRDPGGRSGSLGAALYGTAAGSQRLARQYRRGGGRAGRAAARTAAAGDRTPHRHIRAGGRASWPSTSRSSSCRQGLPSTPAAWSPPFAAAARPSRKRRRRQRPRPPSTGRRPRSWPLRRSWKRASRCA